MAKCGICRGSQAQPRPDPSGGSLVEVGCPTCGKYYISHTASVSVEQFPHAERFRLIAAVRQASEAGQPRKVMSDNLDDIAAAAHRWETLMDGIDRLLLLLAGRAEDFFGSVRVNKTADYPLIVGRDEKEMNELLVAAHRLGLLEATASSVEITIPGWERIDALRAQSPDSRQAFVAMWFADELKDAWTHGFQPGIEKSGYFSAFRIDLLPHNDKIDDRIIAEIRRSGLLVADFTGHRGGVYFEAGFALGLDIPVIWTCRADSLQGLHLDTRQYNHLEWDKPSDLADKLNDRISATVLPKGWRAV